MTDADENTHLIAKPAQNYDGEKEPTTYVDFLIQDEVSWLAQVRAAHYRKWIVFLICILTPVITGSLNDVFTMHASYKTYDISTPDWAPPAWVYPPIWVILYLLIGLCIFLVYHYGDGINRLTYAPIIMFIIQFGFHLAWPHVNFEMGNQIAGLMVISILLGMILSTIIAFTQVSILPAFLMLPYLFWVAFATALHLKITEMNVATN